MANRLGILSITLLSTVTMATTAQAHGGVGMGAGLLHPLSGLDHLLALLAVGILAGRAGGKAVWAIPAAFILFLVAGAVLVLAGAPISGVETTIFASVAILALLAAIATRVNVAVAAGISGLFAVFHGAAHATGVGGAVPASFIAGSVAASIAVIVVGLAAGAGMERLRSYGVAARG